MAHNIGHMFYVGETPWHGLGTELEQPATLDEALSAGALDWTVSTVPLATDEIPSCAVPHRVAVVRDDFPPGDPGRLLGVVHPDFQLLQNRDGAALFDRLFDPGAAKYHTGGYLKLGEVVWLLARLPDEIRVTGDDMLKPYLLYSNSHDGSIAVDIRLTTIRVVCNNTLSAALHDSDDDAFHRRHRYSLDVLAEDAHAFMDFIRQRVTDVGEQFRQLARSECDDAAFRRFLAQILPDPERPAAAASSRSVALGHETRLARLAAARAAIWHTRHEGIPQLGIPPEPATWWGSLNAVTAWVDHLQIVEGSRYAHTMFGAGNRLKSTAFDLAVAGARTRVLELRRAG